jgi:hypothetical protein
VDCVISALSSPAQAGDPVSSGRAEWHGVRDTDGYRIWVPAFAGTTVRECRFLSAYGFMLASDGEMFLMLRMQKMVCAALAAFAFLCMSARAADRIAWPSDLPVYDHVVIVVEGEQGYRANLR